MTFPADQRIVRAGDGSRAVALVHDEPDSIVWLVDEALPRLFPRGQTLRREFDRAWFEALRTDVQHADQLRSILTREPRPYDHGARMSFRCDGCGGRWSFVTPQPITESWCDRCEQPATVAGMSPAA